MARAFHEALLLRKRSRVLDKKTTATTSARGRLRNLLVAHDRRFNYALIRPDEQRARERKRECERERERERQCGNLWML